jgi:hypothetical protein
MNPKKITRQLTAAILCTFICFFLSLLWQRRGGAAL